MTSYAIRASMIDTDLTTVEAASEEEALTVWASKVLLREGTYSIGQFVDSGRRYLQHGRRQYTARLKELDSSAAEFYAGKKFDRDNSGSDDGLL